MRPNLYRVLAVKSFSQIIMWVAVLLAAFLSSDASAQMRLTDDDVADKIALVAEPLELEKEKLVSPGSKVKLRVMIEGTKHLGHRLRALITRDGKLIDISSKSAKFDEQERPVFEVEIPAPMHSLEYQYFLYDSQNKLLASSERYKQYRDCLPVTSNRDLKEDPDDKNAEIRKLLMHSRILERHIAAYSYAGEIFDDIEQLISK